MSGPFDDFDRMVYSFMQEFGFLADYVHNSGGTPNDATGGVDYNTEEFEIQAIKVEQVRPTEGSSNSKSGTTILAGDQILYVRPTEKVDEFNDVIHINPTTDRVRINGVLWKIVTVKEYTPNATDNILYELFVRK